MSETERMIQRVKNLEAALKDLGAWTGLDIHNFGHVIEIKLTANWKPDTTPKRARLSSAQQNLLGVLWREGETYFEKESNTLKSLIKRGLVESRWKPPQPGNDYGGTMRYKLTEAGLQVVQS